MLGVLEPDRLELRRSGHADNDDIDSLRKRTRCVILFCALFDEIIDRRTVLVGDDAEIVPLFHQILADPVAHKADTDQSDVRHTVLPNGF